MKPIFVEVPCTFPKTMFQKDMCIDVNKIKVFCPTLGGSSKPYTIVYFGLDDYVVANVSYEEFKEIVGQKCGGQN